VRSSYYKGNWWRRDVKSGKSEEKGQEVPGRQGGVSYVLELEAEIRQEHKENRFPPYCLKGEKVKRRRT